MAESKVISRLIESLSHLPGVGPKSARRMTYYLLERDRDGARNIAATMVDAVDKIGHCQQCNNLTENEVCDICSSKSRDNKKLCIVETPAELQSIEMAGIFNGVYFVLMGHLSPLDGIGPEELGMDKLESILDDGQVTEVVLATNLTVEGEATAHFINELVRTKGILATRIARGVPIGGELEYIDRNTLTEAFAGRRQM